MTSKIWLGDMPGEYDANQKVRMTWFEKIQPAGNWKYPIACWIDAADFDDCNHAAIFFTGSTLNITAKIGPLSATRLFVEAPGYYATIGA